MDTNIETPKRSNLKKLPEPGSLTKEQVASVVSYLAEFDGRVDIVKEEFEALWERPISADTVYEVRAKYSKQVEAKRTLIYQDMTKVPLARRSMRLLLLFKLVKWALKKRPRYSIRIDRENYLLQELPDAKLAYNCIMGADKIMNDAKRLELEEFKVMSGSLGGDFDDNDEEIDGGVSFDEENAQQSAG